MNFRKHLSQKRKCVPHLEKTKYISGLINSFWEIILAADEEHDSTMKNLSTILGKPCFIERNIAIQPAVWTKSTVGLYCKARLVVVLRPPCCIQNNIIFLEGHLGLFGKISDISSQISQGHIITLQYYPVVLTYATSLDIKAQLIILYSAVYCPILDRDISPILYPKALLNYLNPVAKPNVRRDVSWMLLLRPLSMTQKNRDLKTAKEGSWKVFSSNS